MKRIFFSIIIIILVFVKCTENTTETSVSDAAFNYLPTSTTGQIVKHKYYTLSYNEKYEQAEWVAYKATKKHLSRAQRKRPYFIYDPLVKTKSANYRNYKKSGYDRGHLVPAGDMRFDLAAYNDTFYTSNISPQNHNFNAGIWNRLEGKVRYWTSKYGDLYVITGGVLEKRLAHIGREHVAVPNYFYKIILDKNGKDSKAIAFLIPNKPSEKALYKYVVTIDELEKRTGIDFFPALEDSLENKLESSSSYAAWSFR